MIKLIKADDSTKTLESITFAEVQKAVGGYVEVVRVDGKEESVLLVNEEGRIKNLPVNDSASTAARQHIFGDVVLVSGKEEIDKVLGRGGDEEDEDEEAEDES